MGVYRAYNSLGRNFKDLAPLGSRLYSVINPFIRPLSQEQPEISRELRDAFSEFSAKISLHPACNHDLFKYMQELASGEGLTAKQFEIFRLGMFRRIFPTLGRITQFAADSIRLNKRHNFLVAIDNAIDESGGAESIYKLHLSMCEEAFNATGSIVYKLPTLWMLDAVGLNAKEKGEPFYKLSEAGVAYYAVSELVDKRCPELAFWFSENASGGDNKSRLGMMGNLFDIFNNVYDGSFREEFDQHVLPYFKAHLSIVKGSGDVYRIRFDSKATEYNHGVDAKRLALCALTPQDLEKAGPYILAFANAQARLFDEMLKDIEAAKAIGEKIKPKKKTEAFIDSGDPDDSTKFQDRYLSETRANMRGAPSVG